MDIGLPVLLEVTLVSAGGDHRLVRDLQHTGIAPFGGLHRDTPGLAVRLGPKGLDIAPQLHNSGRNSRLPEQLHQPVPGIALGYGAQVQLRSLREREPVPVQLRPVITDLLQQGGYLLRFRHPVVPGSEAPGANHRVDGDIQSAPGLPAEGQGLLQQFPGVLRQGDRAAAGMVGLMDLTVFIGDGQKSLQLLNARGSFAEDFRPFFRRLVVDGQRHDGVHRHYLCPAGKIFLRRGSRIPTSGQEKQRP